MTIYNRFEPINEFWKHGGVNWQVLQNGEQFDADSMHVYCLNCFYELGDTLKCDDCGRQHKMTDQKTTAAERAAKSLQASKRRKTHSVSAPQVGEKIADVDLELSSNRFMNVKLEKRKQNNQVVITVGDKGKSEKAQIFVDLDKTEIRNDPGDQSPEKFVTGIKLDNAGQSVEKNYKNIGKPVEIVQGPYIYLQNTSYTKAHNQIMFTAYSYESKPYHLESIQIGDVSVDVDRNIEPNGKTESISTVGLPVPPYPEKIEGIYVTVTFGSEKWRIFQEFQLGSRADGQYNLNKIVEKPTSFERIS